jgi:hypothetical protein
MSLASAEDPGPPIINAPVIPITADPETQIAIGPAVGTPSNAAPVGSFLICRSLLLRGCLWANYLGPDQKQALSDARSESTASWRSFAHDGLVAFLRGRSILHSDCRVFGSVFSGTTFSRVPLLFLLVILYVALRFGNLPE